MLVGGACLATKPSAQHAMLVGGLYDDRNFFERHATAEMNIICAFYFFSLRLFG
ncbi:MAG: hypothetical protein ABIW34_13675 [Ginsengibacter sp.]